MIRGRVFALACIGVPMVACSSGGPTDPGGSLTFSIGLRGNSTVAGGVTVASISGGQLFSQRVQPGASVTLAVPPGTHDVALRGLPDHCWTDEERLTVTVERGAPAEAAFELTCIGDFAYSQVDRVVYLGTDGRVVERTFPGPADVLAWRPASSTVLVFEWGTSEKCDVSLLHVATGALTRIGAAGYSYHRVRPTWSDRGDRLAVFRSRGCPRPLSEVAVMLYDGEGTTPLDSIVGLIPGGMAFRPGTNDLAYSDGVRLRLHSWTSGADVPFADVTGGDLVWSPDGSRLAVQGDGDFGGLVIVLDDTGRELFRLGNAESGAFSPTWAPDGSGLLFVAAPAPFGIYYASADGTEVRRVTFQEGWEMNPSWAPDGGYFLYASSRDGRTTVFLGNIHGLPHREIVPVSTSSFPHFRPGAVLGLD